MVNQPFKNKERECLMEIDSIIDKTIEEVLAEKKQPFKKEFIAFVRHVMLENRFDDDEILERIKAITISKGGSTE